jgi:RNA polymerase sigma factor (sigma-70 family)
MSDTPVTPDTDPAEDKPPVQKTVKDYVELIETVARVEYSRLPNHLIDHSELVNIGAIAVHVMLTSNPGKEFNVTYLSTSMKWAIRNELRLRYKWYSLKTAATDSDESNGVAGDGLSAREHRKNTDGDGTGENSSEDGDDDTPAVSTDHVREAVYETILSVDSMMDGENPQEIRDDSYTPEQRSELHEMAVIVRQAIARLPERERAVVEARFFHNKRMREIGEEFNISSSRISRIVQSGLDKIKRELERRGYVHAGLDS